MNYESMKVVDFSYIEVEVSREYKNEFDAFLRNKGYDIYDYGVWGAFNGYLKIAIVDKKNLLKATLSNEFSKLADEFKETQKERYGFWSNR